MIYTYSFLNYIVAGIILFLLIFRLNILLKYYFEKSYIQVIVCTILFHPFSIIAFFLPSQNLSLLGFLIFIEALIQYKKEIFNKSLVFFMLAGVLNLSLCLIPSYFFWLNYKKLKKLAPAFFLYCVLLFFFLCGHLLRWTHNPITFFSYYIQSFFYPLKIDVVNPSLFGSSLENYIVCFLSIALILMLHKLKNYPKELFPLLCLPMVGIFFYPWNVTYAFWHEFIFPPSSFLAITFALTLLLALSISKRIFSLFFLASFVISLFWIPNLFPTSKVLEISRLNLSGNYTQLSFSLNRLIARNYFYENRPVDAKKLFLSLKNEKIDSPAIEQDLKDLHLILPPPNSL
jgi:hypothetical protein